MFDSISARFRNRKIPQIINILETLYKKTSVTFEDETFDTKSGYDKGAWKFLFNLYVDYVMHVFMKKSKVDKNINFFEHVYHIHGKSSTREERMSMQPSNIINHTATPYFPGVVMQTT